MMKEMYFSLHISLFLLIRKNARIVHYSVIVPWCPCGKFLCVSALSARNPLNQSSPQVKGDSNMSAHHVTAVTDAGGLVSIEGLYRVIKNDFRGN